MIDYSTGLEYLASNNLLEQSSAALYYSIRARVWDREHDMAWPYEFLDLLQRVKSALKRARISDYTIVFFNMSLVESEQEIENDDYDEEADSDFDERKSDQESVSSSGHDEPASKITKAVKKATPSKPLIEELDSGDEATIKERQKTKKKQRRKKSDHISSDDEADDAWRAKTRSMRAVEHAERQKKTLASTKTSTIDVDKLWEMLNKPAPLPPVRMEGEQASELSPNEQDQTTKKALPDPALEETVTIKRQFKFAGEVQVEEKVVLKSSAEAKLWLAQQEHKSNPSEEASNGKQRPLRKISRFDPNYSNLEAFQNHSIKAQPGTFKGPKLNVVEKSKMDWASHVDAEGLKDELDEHSKAKGAYLNRMDFLSQVEQRKEAEARLARQKG
ncbi:swr complex subunit [Lithohypha guttulata]|nr:swr complex subunit [Lithohypha guttulata]